MHISQIFETRNFDEDDQADIQSQIDICKRVLSIYLQSIRTLNLSSETNSCLLKVLIGVSEYLLKQPHTPKNYKPEKQWSNQTSEGLLVYMADQLDKELIVVLMETWTRSESTDFESWIHFKKYFQDWMHRGNVVSYWCALKLGLTNRLISALYSTAAISLVVTL